jgi:hypothetical protein
MVVLKQIMYTVTIELEVVYLLQCKIFFGGRIQWFYHITGSLNYTNNDTKFLSIFLTYRCAKFHIPVHKIQYLLSESVVQIFKEKYHLTSNTRPCPPPSPRNSVIVMYADAHLQTPFKVIFIRQDIV